MRGGYRYLMVSHYGSRCVTWPYFTLAEAVRDLDLAGTHLLLRWAGAKGWVDITDSSMKRLARFV